MGNMIAGVIRAVAPAIIAWLVAKGLTPDVAGQIMSYTADAVAAIVTLGSALWSIRSNLFKHKTVDILSDDSVKKIIVTQATAAELRKTAPELSDKIKTS